MMQHKKAWSIACLLLSLLLLFVPWSKDYSTSSFRGNIGCSANTKYSGDEINAVADTVEDGASPFELIKFSFYYADILYGYTEGGLAGVSEPQVPENTYCVRFGLYLRLSPTY